MSFVWEFIGVWKQQYFAMVRIQFPEFFRSAVWVIYAFVTALPVHKANRIIRRSQHKCESAAPSKEDPNVDKVECEVLYDPPPGTRQGDVIIIHGLHGSLTKTWRQGSYDSSKVKKIELRRHLSPTPKMLEKPTCQNCKRLKRSLAENRLNRKDNNNRNSRSCSEENCRTNHAPPDSDSDGSERTAMNEFDINYRTATFSNEFPTLSSDDNEEDESYVTFSSDADLRNALSRERMTSPRNDYGQMLMSDFVMNQLNQNNNTIPENICDFDDDSNNIEIDRVNRKETAIGNSELDGRFVDLIEWENEIDFETNKGARSNGAGRDRCDDRFCSCEIEISSGYVDRRRYEKHLKCHLYGDGSLLVRECIFYFKFLVNIFKQLYAMYRKLWDDPDDRDSSNCWPRDWLPIDCPHTRLISISYTTFLWTPIWYKSCNRTSLQQKALEMARQLESLGVGEKPIVWAAHSKGGLFIKQMFINSWKGYGGISRDIFSNTRTIAFYSVPHHGSVLAHVFTPPIVRPSVEIVEIRTGSQMVSKLQDEFREALEAAYEREHQNSIPYIVSYTETIPTNMSGFLLQIVFPMSADPGVGEFYGIPLDHRMICKFESRNCLLYKDLIALIQQACKQDTSIAL